MNLNLEEKIDYMIMDQEQIILWSTHTYTAIKWV